MVETIAVPDAGADFWTCSNFAKRLDCGRFTAALLWENTDAAKFGTPAGMPRFKSGAEARAVQTLSRWPNELRISRLRPGVPGAFEHFENTPKDIVRTIAVARHEAIIATPFAKKL
jgi:hypothetical protein